MASLLAGGCVGTPPPHGEVPLALVAWTSVPSATRPAGTVFGGISGLDHDRGFAHWYLISDNRSERGPVGFWRARIDVAAGPMLTIDVDRLVTLRDASRNSFPAPGTGGVSIDAESIRKRGDHLVWSSEGDPLAHVGPSIWITRIDGRWQQNWPLPRQFAADPAGRAGPRANRSIEAIATASDGDLWVMLEAPLIEDGPLPSATAGADVRLSRLSLGGRLKRQYAYRLEPIGSHVEGRRSDNGVSEMLAIDDRHFLIQERAGLERADNDFDYHTRLFCAAVDGATDVASRATLAEGGYVPLAKRLLFDSRYEHRIAIGNVEGLAWGPRLPDGRATLVAMTDNDFSPRRDTQFLLFAFSGRSPCDPSRR